MAVKFWFSTRVSVGKSKLCQSTEEEAWSSFLCTCRFEELRSTTRSPFVRVDQNTLDWGSEITRLPLKKSCVWSDQLASSVGLASQSGSEEGTWRTARASWVLLTRRKASEKLPVESLRRGWKVETFGFGVALKPWRSTWAVDRVVIYVKRMDVVKRSR